MKERPEQPDQQKESETITPDEFESQIDEFLDELFLDEVCKEMGTTRGAIREIDSDQTIH